MILITFRMKNFSNKAAFTLAEVLITLMIIGVVAGIVVPTIIQDSQDAEFKTAYKKAYAVGASVTKQMLANSEFMVRSGTFDAEATSSNWNIFKSYFNVARDCSASNNAQCWDSSGEMMQTGNYFLPGSTEKAFIDNSGMAWSLYSNSENIILVDTNGFKAPNRYGKDRWIFTEKGMDNVRVNTSLPSKLYSYSNVDITVINNFYCHYPPCYFKTWLLP